MIRCFVAVDQDIIKVITTGARQPDTAIEYGLLIGGKEYAGICTAAGIIKKEKVVIGVPDAVCRIDQVYQCTVEVDPLPP